MTTRRDADILLNAAARLIDEFDTFGEVLQTDSDDGTYGPDSAVEKLRAAVQAIDPQAVQPTPVYDD